MASDATPPPEFVGNDYFCGYCKFMIIAIILVEGASIQTTHYGMVLAVELPTLAALSTILCGSSSSWSLTHIEMRYVIMTEGVS